ncbi:hypothetical protein [Nocardioides alcanivorans]|uniref:hypothetical protein n=1 Tax=Nocardioides alcanivorans TaxID=2897352 RepID=UPI001F3E61B4|nr:hypothetical protein [Nocardioides alcanivorans]
MATLTEKYVHAVTRSLPEDQRDDVADELRATIADRADSLRHEDGQLDQEQAEYAAVAELDDPIRLSARYAGRPLHLIGPAVYPSYVRLLKAILLAVLPVIAVVTVVVQVLDGDNVGAVVGHTAWTTFTVGVQIVFWVTLVCILVERGSAPEDVTKNLGADWSPDDLPEPPRATQFPLGELIASVVFLLVAIAFLVGQHFWTWHEDGSEALPMLDPDLWTFWLPFLIAVAIAMIGFEIIKWRTGHWTSGLAIANTVLGLLFAAPVVWLAATDRLLNPALLPVIDEHVGDPGHINTVIVIATVAITLWDLVDSWRKVDDTPGELN